MPLRDHFRPPLKQQRPWEACHSVWLNAISEALNVSLPKGYYSLPEVHAGASIEIDIATFGDNRDGFGLTNGPTHSDGDSGGIAVAELPKVYAPAAMLTVETALADDFEIRIWSEITGRKLVAAIELVSPANKDRPESRTAFATKCASYLHNSVAVIIIDVVTERTANLHDEIVPLVTSSPVSPMGESTLYSVAYRPIRRKEKDQIDAWPQRLAIGVSLPVLPLWLNAIHAVPVDLESTYATALRRARIE